MPNKLFLLSFDSFLGPRLYQHWFLYLARQSPQALYHHTSWQYGSAPVPSLQSKDTKLRRDCADSWWLLPCVMGYVSPSELPASIITNALFPLRRTYPRGPYQYSLRGHRSPSRSVLRFMEISFPMQAFSSERHGCCSPYASGSLFGWTTRPTPLYLLFEIRYWTQFIKR